jgi:hypothetical protein
LDGLEDKPAFVLAIPDVFKLSIVNDGNGY